MIIPVRCVSCGNVIGSVWEEYRDRVEAGEDEGDVMDDLGMVRYCCRRHLLSHADVLDEVIPLY